VKILQLVQKPQQRGVEIFTAQLASRINAAGHEAVMVFLFPGKSELPFSGKMVHLQGRQGLRFLDFDAWRRLAQIIANEKPDIIQANAGDTLRYAVLSKLLFRWKQPIIFRNASTISLYIKNRMSAFWNAFFFRYVVKIISVSNTSAQDFGQVFPSQRKKITTIPIGIEDANVGFLEEKNLPTNKMAAHGPVYIHVGGFSFEKNHEGLLDVLANIRQQQPNASLHLVGDGPLRTKIEELVNRKGLAAHVTFYGFQRDVLPLIKSADVLLLPSIIEGLPGVILEAFLCKTPVVAFDVGGIGDVLLNNQTGFLIKKMDYDSFVKAALIAAEKSAATEKLVQNAYDLVTSQYLNSQIARKFLGCYSSILTKRQPSLRTANQIKQAACNS
jgi:L-malate glycosyltransferase